MTSIRSSSENRLRVMQLAAPGRAGGLETVLEQLAVGLLARNVDIRVGLVMPPGAEEDHPLLQSLVKAEVPVHPILVGGRSYLAERRAVLELLEHQRVQVVHTHGYRADVIAGSVARRTGRVHVTTLHGFVGATRRGRFYEWLQVRSALRADSAIAVSAQIAARLKGAGAIANVRIIPNAMTPHADQVARADAREALGLPAEANIVGWVGRASVEKGLDVFLRALSRTPGPLSAAVVGDGPELNSIRSLAAELGIGERIHFCGLIPQAGRFLAAFDFLALTSRTEGTPMVLLEAMWAGVPILATGVGGVPDLVGDTALVCAPSDSEAVSEGLQRLVVDHQLRSTLSTAALKRVQSQFSAEQWLTRHVELYHESMSRRIG